MAHLSRQNSLLIARVQRIIGQLNSVLKALERDGDCSEVLQLVASCRGAINGLTVEVLEEHIRSHVLDPKAKKTTERDQAAMDVITALRTYVK